MQRITRLFPIWAVLASAAAYLRPGLFTPLQSSIAPLLGVIMFGMGMTLRVEDFRYVARQPAAVGIGVGLQVLLMPLFGWAVGKMLGLPPELLAGMVLVGSCPGGTASNVISYLAKADVALSIALTSVSTLIAVITTPALTWLYIGRVVPVPVAGMLVSILQVIILPVVLGVGLNTVWGRRLGGIRDVFPLISVMGIVLVIAVIVALNQARLAQAGALVVLAVMLHNGLGLAGGYGAAKWLRLPEAQARTVGIEVGMQNSGLGAVLAVAHFTPLAALPAAVFSLWHNLTGSVLAWHWSRRTTSLRRAEGHSSCPV
ncbi:MAG TPA: bile acid:sodium symporter family protein [bacterium]